MNQEMLPSRMSAGGGADAWLQAQPLDTYSAPASPHGTPLKKLHRLLRGRYLLATILACVGAIVGAGLGWMSQKPQYRSNGLIEINPIIASPLATERVMLMYNSFIQNQIALLQSQRVITEAMSSDEWKRTNRGADPDVTAQFNEQLDVSSIPGTTFIRISFLDKDKGVAQVAVAAVINAYKAAYGQESELDSQRTLQQLYERKNKESSDITVKRKQIDELAGDYGVDGLQQVHTTKLQELTQLEATLAQAKFNLDSMQGTLGTDKKATSVQPLSNEQIAGVDRRMHELMDEQQELELSVDRFSQMYGPNHRTVLTARSNLETLKQKIDLYGDTFRKRGVQIMTAPDGTGTAFVDPSVLSLLRLKVDHLQKSYDEMKAYVSTLGARRQQIGTLQTDIAALKDSLDNTSRLLDERLAESQGKGQLSVVSTGDTPLFAAVDRRKQTAALGFVGGGFLPVALLLAFGLADRRYRFSDDANHDLSGIPLLGILPNLPDLLTDPEQAAIAAHCVHQIRTMLQINSSEERRVFCVTSPSPGDGKTSLSLALGLSFAASGSRTLLIDCDLVGAGLTSRMNVTSPEGVLEAIANRSLLPYVQNTDIDNLVILPVGSAQAHHSSMLSPAAVRKIINEAKANFDVVLIDTGPILGSIEAAPVASAADGVVLTVSRGQQRPLVEKSMAHLIAIGARLSGVVFNRAQSRDFEQSVSRLSMRSMPRANGHPLDDANRLGPVAKAVAGAGRSHDENGNGLR